MLVKLLYCTHLMDTYIAACDGQYVLVIPHSVATGSQSGDPLTHWLRPGDPDGDPDVTRIKKFKA